MTVEASTGSASRRQRDRAGRPFGGGLAASGKPVDLTTVIQSSQTRNFTYDSLKRLLTSSSPESGNVSTAYTYDQDGNIKTKTDARGISTTFAYDQLNRVTAKTYSDGTPSASFAYDLDERVLGDTTQNYPIGRLSTTGVSGGSTTTFNRYTPSGWIAASTQVTNGQTFPFAYTYNVAGGLETMSYPSGRQVTNCYSAAGRVTTLGNGPLGSSASFVSNALYAPDGQLSQMLLGNGVTETIGFNARLQPTSVVVTGSAGTTLSLGYGYGGSNNNGNVQSQSIVNLGASQAYSYDPLNRVATAQETGGPGWQEAFSYDAYGNRWVSSSSGLTFSPLTPTVSGEVSGATNRLVGSNYGYDAAGNETFMSPYTFSFDAESRPSGFSSANGNQFGSASYAYDGAGRRVMKTLGSAVTVYVYDAFGTLSAEYGNTPTVPPCSTCYLIADTLGSIRAVTDPVGNVVSRHDFLPFGEELVSSTLRTPALGYGTADDVRQRFTGKERDARRGWIISGPDTFQGRRAGLLAPIGRRDHSPSPMAISVIPRH